MSFRFLGVRFYISVPFTVMLAALLFMDKSGLMSVSLAAVVIHEAGHILVMKLLKCAPSLISFNFQGMLISGVKFCSAKENILIALSGPIANILFSLVFYCLYLLSSLYSFAVFAAVSFLVGLLNILPIKGLDGGTVLRELCSLLFSKNGGIIFSLISVFSAVAVILLGIIGLIKNKDNPSLLLLGIYLLILNLLKIDRM